MYIITFLLLASLLLILVLKMASTLISEKSMLMREEMSSYECGFEHHNLSRVPFSLRYFFLTLIFLLFDLEIVFMMFVPSILFSNSYYLALLILLVFVVILYASLVYEWTDGTLDWVN